MAESRLREHQQSGSPVDARKIADEVLVSFRDIITFDPYHDELHQRLVDHLESL
jgi:hypothetical protein